MLCGDYYVIELLECKRWFSRQLTKIVRLQHVWREQAIVNFLMVLGSAKLGKDKLTWVLVAG